MRGYRSGHKVVDTIAPVQVWEIPYYPAYYIPAADVDLQVLSENGQQRHSPSRGDAKLFDLTVAGSTVTDAAWTYADSRIPELNGLIRFEWEAMDSWFEEDEEVFVHPRSPYVRVDILASSRHVRVLVDDEIVADSVRPTLLFETNLPTRYYFPQTDVRLELLTASDAVSHCPYKGSARYWSVVTSDNVHSDLAWSYPTPLAESQKIAGLVAFYNEKVDIEVDGVMLERPRTKFS